MAGRPARAPPAEARPSGRDGRRPARGGGGRRRQGRIVDVGAGVGAVGLALAQRNAACLRRSCRDRSRGWRRLPMATRSATGFRRARASCGSTSSTRGRAARRGWRNWPVASSPTRRSSTPTRSASLPTKARRERMSWPAASRARRLADWIQASLAMLAPGGRFVMIHRPEALGADPRRDWKPARRARASAGSSDHRRERASPARLGRQGLQGAAAPRAWADPARSLTAD